MQRSQGSNVNGDMSLEYSKYDWVGRVFAEMKLGPFIHAALCACMRNEQGNVKPTGLFEP